jgi:4-hydroxybenzoate polyprenyltransferase
VLKDILTLGGDVSIGYPTLAATRGVRVATVVGALFLLFSVITSPVPFLFGAVGVAYLFPIVAWGGVVVVTAVPLLSAPKIENVRERLRIFTTYFPYIVGVASVAYVLPFIIWGAQYGV